MLAGRLHIMSSSIFVVLVGRRTCGEGDDDERPKLIIHQYIFLKREIMEDISRRGAPQCRARITHPMCVAIRVKNIINKV